MNANRSTADSFKFNDRAGRSQDRGASYYSAGTRALMVHYLLNLVRSVTDIFTAQESPGEMAGGLALGMLIGIVPKENLLAAILATLLLVLRVNLATALLATALFSWIALLLDPVTDALGYFLLTLPVLEPAWTFLAGLPFVPWTQFNHSIVLGSWVLGLALFYPVFRLSRWAFTKYLPLVAEKLKQYRVIKILDYTQLGWRWRFK